MKKIVLLLLMVVGGISNGFAQKGMNGVGVNIPVGIGGGFLSVGAGVKYQYNFSNYFRIEPSFEYFPIYTKKDYKGIDDYDYAQLKAFLNGHIFLMAPRPARPYVLVGAGFTQFSCSTIDNNTLVAVNQNGKTTSVGTTYYDSWSNTEECFTYNIGIGYDIRLSHQFSMQIEGTAFSALGGSGTSKSATVAHEHSGKWSFMGRIGFTYNF